MKQVKILTVLVSLLSLSFIAAAQINTTYLKVRADSNLRYLLKGKHRINPLEIQSDRISIWSPTNSYQPIFSLYWSEVPKFIEIMESKNSFEVYDMVKGKGNGYFPQYMPPQNFDHYREYPIDFNGLYVAIDPGHFGGNQEEAMYERRIVNVEGSQIGEKKNGFFHEAELTYATALIIKEKLEALGAHVLITRPNGAGAKQKSFNQWIKEDFRADLEQQHRTGQITDEYYKLLQPLSTDSLNAKDKYTLFEFYKFLDFRTRIDKINDFNPNITLVLHFNATEGSKPYGTERFTKPVKSNYSMAFIPGAFMAGELDKHDAILDFTRLTLSPDFENSERLAHLILKEHQRSMRVNPIIYDSLKDLQSKVNKTQYDGVFARNLPMTRMVRGTIVYLESFCQDNVDMMKQLIRKDLTVNDPGKGPIKTSKVCQQTATDVIQGITAWLNENKEETSRLSTRKN